MQSAMSEGSPTKPSGMALAASSAAARSPPPARSCMPVQITPGCTELQRIWSSPSPA